MNQETAIIRIEFNPRTGSMSVSGPIDMRNFCIGILLHAIDHILNREIPAIVKPNGNPKTN